LLFDVSHQQEAPRLVTILGFFAFYNSLEGNKDLNVSHFSHFYKITPENYQKSRFV